MRKVRIVETGEEFRSLTDCARHIDGLVESIYKCLNGRIHQHCGFTFEYVDEFGDESLPYLKMGQAIKNALDENTGFDEYQFAEEMRSKRRSKRSSFVIND